MGGRRSEHEVKVCEEYAGGGGAPVRHLQRRTGRTPEGAWGDGRGRSPAWATGGRYHAAASLLQISRCRLCDRATLLSSSVCGTAGAARPNAASTSEVRVSNSMRLGTGKVGDCDIQTHNGRPVNTCDAVATTKKINHVPNLFAKPMYAAVFLLLLLVFFRSTTKDLRAKDFFLIRVRTF